jgi:rubredoxin
MTTNMQQSTTLTIEYQESFQEIRQAVLNGELDGSAAVMRLVSELDWGQRKAALAVGVWKSLRSLQCYQTTDIERMARLLRIPKFGEPTGMPESCPGFGQELPADWTCPPCPLKDACYEALRAKEAREKA